MFPPEDGRSRDEKPAASWCSEGIGKIGSNGAPRSLSSVGIYPFSRYLLGVCILAFPLRQGVCDFALSSPHLSM